MGEIRTKVRLMNFIDEGMQRRGELAAADVRWVEVDVVVDTGAERSVSPINLAERLGIQTRKHDRIFIGI